VAAHLLTIPDGGCLGVGDQTIQFSGKIGDSLGALP